MKTCKDGSHASASDRHEIPWDRLAPSRAHLIDEREVLLILRRAEAFISASDRQEEISEPNLSPVRTRF